MPGSPSLERALHRALHAARHRRRCRRPRRRGARRQASVGSGGATKLTACSCDDHDESLHTLVEGLSARSPRSLITPVEGVARHSLSRPEPSPRRRSLRGTRRPRLRFGGGGAAARWRARVALAATRVGVGAKWSSACLVSCSRAAGEPALRVRGRSRGVGSS